jgi:cytochrome c oxidase subunit 3
MSTPFVAIQEESPIQGVSRGRIAEIGMYVLLVPILMFFLALASAYVVRHGFGEAWIRIPLPPLLWGNTVVLLVSSLLLEVGRRARGQRIRIWLWGSVAMGTLFVLGQWMVWQQLLASGIRIESSGHSSFFYLLTAAHAIHLMAGLLGLLLATTWPQQGRWSLGSPDVIRIAAIYWHFMAALWLGIVLLLALGR